jgi:hypothetical protein
MNKKKTRKKVFKKNSRKKMKRKGRENASHNYNILLTQQGE